MASGAIRYGFGYQGSKNQICRWLMEHLPRGKRFVDLFGGGFAVSHAALLSGKYKTVYYNELDADIVEIVRRHILNREQVPKEWISREDFLKLKDENSLIKLFWSFNQNGNSYCYSKEIEPWKKALHYVRVYGDRSLLQAFGIESDGSRADIRTHEEEYKRKYIKWYIKTFFHKDIEDIKLRLNLKEKIKENSEKLRNYLIEGLKKSGKKAVEVDHYLDTNGMANHYFGRSQWEFPTRENYVKLQNFLYLPLDYDKIYGLQELYESLQSLQSLESLQRLQSLESLQSLETNNLQVSCGSYLDYYYLEGDVVYCDPPYENTNQESYSGQKRKNSFDSKQFYDWVFSRPFQVFFSSYEISDDRFYELDKIKKINNFTSQGGGKKNIERLYSNKPFAGAKKSEQTTIFDFLKE